MNDMLAHGVKLVVASSIAMGGIAAATINSVTGDPEFDKWILAIRELSSFAVIAIFALGIGVLMYKSLPMIAGFLASATDKFLQELQQEREARERSLIDFREMLAAHSDKVGLKIDEQTRQIDEQNTMMRQQTQSFQDLCENLKSRPCQK